MAYPSGSDFFDQYLLEQNKRQGLAPRQSLSAPATRSAMPPTHAPTGSAEPGIMSQLGDTALDAGKGALKNQMQKMMQQYMQNLSKNGWSWGGGYGAAGGIGGGAPGGLGAPGLEGDMYSTGADAAGGGGDMLGGMMGGGGDAAGAMDWSSLMAFGG